MTERYRALMIGHGATLLFVGLLAGPSSELAIGTFLFKRVHVIGVAVGAYKPPEAQAAWAEIVKTLAKAGRRPLIDRAFPFSEVQEAFAHLARGPMGKVLIGPIEEG